MSVTIASDGTTTGALAVPASITGDEPLAESMAGTAVRTGNTLKFQQSADTFVRDLTWTINGNALEVQSQTLSGTLFTATLTRQ